MKYLKEILKNKSMDRNTIKKLIFPKLIIRFNVILHRIQTFFMEFDKLFLKFITTTTKKN